ncbi:hypothetical protein V8C26DRAFT_264992 [Trichoderma gracile]
MHVLWHVPGPTTTHTEAEPGPQPGKSPVPLAASPDRPVAHRHEARPAVQWTKPSALPSTSASMTVPYCRGSGRMAWVESRRGETGESASSEARSPPSISIAITSVGLAASMRVDGSFDALAILIVEPEKTEEMLRRESSGPPSTRASSQPVLCNIPDPRQNRDRSKVGIASCWTQKVAAWAPDGSIHGSTGVILWPKRAGAISMTVRGRGRRAWKHAKGTAETVTCAVTWPSQVSFLGKWPAPAKAQSLGAVKASVCKVAQFPGIHSPQPRSHPVFCKPLHFSGLFPWHWPGDARPFGRPFWRC